MTTVQMIGIGLFIFTVIIVIAHYRFKWMKQHQVVETIANTSGVMAFALVCIIFAFPGISGLFFNDDDYFHISKNISLSSRPDLNFDQKRFMAQETAEIVARASLAASVENHIESHANVELGSLTAQQISSKVNVVLALAEVVDGEFLEDGSYQITMRAPKPKPEPESTAESKSNM